VGIHAIFDLPWAPIYIAVIFVLHPFLGAFALGCSILLILMALLNEWLVKLPLTEAGEAASRSYSFTEMSLRNTEVVRAMGMTEGLLRRWARDRNRMLERQVSASDSRRHHAEHHPFSAACHAVDDTWPRRLSCDRATCNRRRYVRREHSARKSPAAGRADRRILAQPCFCPWGIPAHPRALESRSPTRGRFDAAAPEGPSLGRGANLCAAA
jgi:hypothetical protein